jgi:hypothetical protein
MKKGSTVTMTENAVENYGAEWAGVELVITSAANKYMPAAKFFASGSPAGYHPGYDEGLNGEYLYDLKIKRTGESVNFSLYAYELTPA